MRERDGVFEVEQGDVINSIQRAPQPLTGFERIWRARDLLSAISIRHLDSSYTCPARGMCAKQTRLRYDSAAHLSKLTASRQNTKSSLLERSKIYLGDGIVFA